MSTSKIANRIFRDPFKIDKNDIINSGRPITWLSKNDQDITVEESNSWEFVNDILSSLSLTKKPGKIKGIEILKRSISLIEEMKQENVLDEKESKALLEYIACKFIESRISEIFDNIFDIEYPESFNLKSASWSIKYGKK